MKLITESVEDIIVESVFDEETKKKTYKIQGIFLQANKQNKNKRIYPTSILEQEVNRYNNSHIAKKRAMGELGHPQGPSINLERVSHKITKLIKDGDNFIGEAVLLDTPYGKIAKNFLDEEIVLGVSSRGMGSLRSRGNGLHEVGNDFHLATPADIVADPSAPDAFVQGIMEGKEWVWNNGVLTERDVAGVKTIIEKSVRNGNLTEGKIHALETYFDKLSNVELF